ncbi:hypothetical protein [Limnoglobus roseus]|uniref:DUF2306 domain-containing protein n=1 Tax=Limnoglobus roseus TaxID=2598579 RepID=A0A5C1AGZ6_9BACT|nr:hypothetical protein [Limnoglobus roseus]QEL16384.1 hypothetical protein PX52LOC_03336 [Limnoglobus roseus]
MTVFTLLHTIISVLPVGLGLAAYARRGAIDPKTRLGRWYVGTMLAGTVTGFGFILTIGFTPGQALGLLTLALLAIGTLTLRGNWRKAGYTQTVALSASYLLLWVFLTTETLKRFPTGKPFASSPADPALIPVRIALLAAFVIGVTFQVLKIRMSTRHAQKVTTARLAA